MEIKQPFITIKLVILCCLLVIEVDASIGSVDYSNILKADKYFVDKTLLIKAFLNEDQQDPTVKIVTAPTKFGKSTIVDMLKRFLAIPVDGEGRRVALNTTENYKLFCDNNLTICEDKTFVEQHMGQYPVIHVNYHNLETIDSYVTLLQQLRTVIRITFEEHEYLVRNSTLFTGNLTQDLFTRHCSVTGVRSLSDILVLDAFVWLSRLLCQHFSSQVIVLMDEYDAYANEMLFGKPFEEGEILKFLDGINRKLFNSNNNCVKKALLTGILRVNELGYSLPNTNVKGYRWLDDHEFAQFYGFTTSEVSKLIKKFTINKVRRKKIRDIMKLYYGGYMVQNTNTTLYNIWSVIQFFLSDTYPMKIDNYWCKSSRLNQLEELIFTNRYCISSIKRLLVRITPFYVNISSPLGQNDLTSFKRIHLWKNATKLRKLMFELGFLTPMEQKKSGVDHLTPLSFPNSEIYIQYSRLINRYFSNKYNIQLINIKNVQSALDLFKLNRAKVPLRVFYSAVYRLIKESTYCPAGETELASTLSILLSSAFPFGKCIRYKLNDKDFTKTPVLIQEKVKAKLASTKNVRSLKRREILLINRQQISIAININCQKGITAEKNKVKESLNELAIDAVSDLIATYGSSITYDSVISFERSRIYKSKGRVYIGIAFDLDNRDFSMAFFNLKNPENITLIEK